MRGRWQKEKERILSAHRARLESYNVELTSTSTAVLFLTVDRLYSSAIHAWTALLTTP
jgi:DNA anti-recombination protein RmuC